VEKNANELFVDTVYFHLPSLEPPHSTIYCVSCYRQMQATVSSVCW